MATYFSATPEDINRLSPDSCAQVFGEMLKSEAFEIGIPSTAVTTTYTSVPDAGIDARVKCQSPAGGHLIVGHNPSYQIKAGEEFAPWQPSEINRELFGNKEHKAENLGTETRRCFESGYTYILVCMKIHLTPARQEQALENLKRAVEECGLPTPVVEVWGQDHILTCLNRIPGLALRLNGRDHGEVLSHQSWSEQEDMRKPLEIDLEQEDIINKIQSALRSDSTSVHVNVCGETGVGKTRLVLEATRDPELSSLVVYCGSPKLFYNSPLNEIRRNEVNAILVIDDCLRDEIWEKVREMGTKIKLVTISSEKKRIRYTEQLDVPPLSEVKIKEIILKYRRDDIIAGRLAQLCGGIPRFAHIVGFDAQNHPDDPLDGADMGGIFTRYIRYGDEPDSEQTRRMEIVLLTLALFKRFGRGRYFKDESRAVLGLVQKLDSNITPAFFEETIDKLKDRKILQGEETLYPTPIVLHVWLWAKWWKRYRHALDVDEIVNDLPPSLAELFYKMFEYSARSPVAGSTLKRLFGESGLLHDSAVLKTANGSKLFHALSRADPHTAVRHLEKTMSRWTETELHSFTEGRRYVIYGLERIMFEPGLFVKGGRLLRCLAEAENEEWANNATGTFCDMFSLSTGYLSNTRAAPHDRLPLLRETLCDRNENRRSLGLKACKSALTVKQASLSSLAHDDFELDVKGWEPVSIMQLQESYQSVITMLCEKIKEFPADAQHTTAKIILDASRSLLRELPGMAEYLIDRISDLRSIAGDEAVLNTIMQVVEFDGEWIGPDAVKKLERIESAIEGRSYAALMKRYVMMDVLVDLLSRNHERSREEKIKELARESTDAGKLRPHLKWLVTEDAKWGSAFGYELSLQDVNESLLSEILDAQRNTGENGSGFFLSGYLVVIFQKDRNRWNEVMREIAGDEKLRRFLIELSCRSGITDEIGMLILDLVRDSRLPAEELTKIVPAFPSKPSPNVVQGWIGAMVEDGRSESIASALRMFHSLFIRQKVAIHDAKLTLRLLTHDALFEKNSQIITNPLVDHYWKEIAMELIKQYDGKSPLLCNKILENMDPTSMLARSGTLEVLNKIASESPNEVWDMAVRYIGKPLDEQGYAISNWMRGGISASASGFLEVVDHERVFDWIDGDPHYRAPHIARYAPPILQNGSLVMELLKKYGSDERVGRNLLANFMTGFFSGSAVEYYRKNKEEVLEYKKTEDNENSNHWLDSYLEILDKNIERETVLEERMPV